MNAWNQILEDAIIGKLITTLIDNNFKVEVGYYAVGLFVYAAEDGDSEPKDGYKYWIMLVPGNGCDVISDYTTNLEAIIKPVNDFAATFQ